MKSQINDFTNGKILSPLLNFAFPILLAIVLQAMYGAVDLLVVGRFGEASDVSAVATGSQIMQSVTYVIVGISMGTTILLGQKIGQKKSNDAGDVIGSGICLFAILAVAVTLIMFLSSNGIATAMQAPAEAYSKTVDYIKICSLGAVFIISYNVVGSVFRGIGDSKTPLLTVLIASVINIFGDLLFVAVLDMAAVGAALATVISQAISVIGSFIIIKKCGVPFEFSLKNIRFYKTYIGKTLKLGIPIALQDLLVGLSFLIIQAIVNNLGVNPSAGVGVAEKLCVFVMLVPSAFMQSMSAFIAQNIGAKKYDRARKALLYSIIVSLSCGLIMFYITFFHGTALSLIFTNDISVAKASADYLKSYAIDCILTSFLFSFIGFFNGCGKTTFVMIQGIIGAFLIRVPVSYFMSNLKPVSLFKIGLATPCSTVVQIILCLVCFLVISKKVLVDENKYDNKLS